MLAGIFSNVLPPGSVPEGLATLAMAVTIGIALGSVRVFGIKLGVSAVLFAALGFAQCGITVNDQILSFLRDFALVLFVYSIGLQMGPGFVASLRAEGLRLNILAVSVVVLGAITTVTIVYFAHLPKEVASGLFTGGFATTPALAAGQDALSQILTGKGISPATAIDRTSLAYSVAYPFGLTGPIVLVIVFKFLFRVNINEEKAKLAASELVRRPPIGVLDIEVTNPTFEGVALRDNRFHRNLAIIFTRLLRGGSQIIPSASTTLHIGDVVRIVGPQKDLNELAISLGKVAQISLAELTGGIHREHLVVTNRRVLGKTLRELDLTNRHSVTLARIHRAGADMPARAGITLHFGDELTALGPVEGLKAAADELGNSTEQLNQTQLIPIFLGFWLGVIVGSIPVPVPGLGTSLRIGLAGGPMIVAILLSRLGHLGSVIWHMPQSANQILRDFGMAVFLACVGFQSGDHFLQKLFTGGGLPLVAMGAIVTLVPMFLVGLFARVVWKMNYITLCGLISGSMTSSPTLLFSNESTESTSPAIAYATVYPLSMLIPVFCSQFLVTLLMR